MYLISSIYSVIVPYNLKETTLRGIKFFNDITVNLHFTHYSSEKSCVKLEDEQRSFKTFLDISTNPPQVQRIRRIFLDEIGIVE